MGRTEDIWIDKIISSRATLQRFVPPVERPVTAAEAYRIQAGVAQHIGEVGGFKTALKKAQQPIMAPIFASDIVPSGARVGVRDMIGIELEIGFQIAADIPSGVAKLPLDELARLLRPVAVIELVDTRTEGAFAEDDIVKLADNQINAGLVVGSPVQNWSRTDFGALTARMQAGADIILDGEALVPGGSALAAVASLARQLGDHCGGLKRNQIIITGSLHPLVYYPKGTRVEGWIAGLGDVSVTLGR